MKIRARRTTSVRLLICFALLVSTLSCFAPQIYASTSADCDRWLAEYKQGLLQKRAAQHLAAAKRRAQRKLMGIVFHPHLPTHPRVRRAALPRNAGPLARLKRFALDCGDVLTPTEVASLPPIPLVPPVQAVTPDEVALLFNPTPPPVGLTSLPPSGAGFPPPAAATNPPTGPGFFPPVVPGPGPGAPVIPGTPAVPGTPTIPIIPPVTPVVPPAPSPAPEPGSFLLLLTGAGAVGAAWKRRLVSGRPEAA